MIDPSELDTAAIDDVNGRARQLADDTMRNVVVLCAYMLSRGPCNKQGKPSTTKEVVEDVMEMLNTTLQNKYNVGQACKNTDELLRRFNAGEREMKTPL